jgi:DNA-binding XRE family transcriptional regulator
MRFKELRARQKLSQVDLAAKVGRFPEDVARPETDHHDPP